MKNIVLFIGDELRDNPNFLEYIFRHCKEFSLEYNEIKFVNKNDKNLPNFIENLAQKYDFITAFASNDSYGIISKILATLTGDLLELQNETLAPSMAQKVEKNSFLLNLKDCQINVLKASAFENLPPILTPCEKKTKIFYIFEYKPNYIKERIEPLLQTYNVGVVLSKFSEFLTLVKVKENEFSQIDEFIANTRKIFDNFVIEDENFIAFIVKKLADNGAKITFAESCTAGLCASKLGEISGASEVFDGSLVTYSNEIKHAWLGVNSQILQEFGAVSKECVSQMLNGALKNSKAEFALAVSGIAGPSGGTAQKPVGTVIIGVGEKNGEKFIGEFHIGGDRNFVRNEAANIAFCLFLKLKTDLFFKN